MKQTNQAKKHLKKNSLIACLSTTILALSLTAGTCGTFAWFTYATRTYVEYEGVTIGMGGSIQLGFDPHLDLTNYANYGLEREEYEGRYLYWSNGDADENTLNYILSSMGYATDKMSPVSSGSYSYGDSDFSLHRAPRLYEAIQPEAEKKEYIFLPMVFRVTGDLEPDTYVPNQSIYLLTANVKSEENIRKSIRIHTSNADSTHLINPTIETDGSIKVGGALDLNGDGYYDTYDENINVYEFMYGEYEGDKVHKNTPEAQDSDVPESERTTFLARHKMGTYAVDDTLSTPKTADYEGFRKFAKKQTPIAKTNEETSNYAFVDLTAFIEGWDLSVIEAEKGNQFSLELKFGIAEL